LDYENVLELVNSRGENYSQETPGVEATFYHARTDLRKPFRLVNARLNCWLQAPPALGLSESQTGSPTKLLHYGKSYAGGGKETAA
jgi:hypothetical protein